MIFGFRWKRFKCKLYSYGWYGISLNAINNGCNFLLIDSSFVFCLLSNSFIKKPCDDELLSLTKGEKSNHYQQNLYIDWQKGKYMKVMLKI